jgi:hypothetical protein
MRSWCANRYVFSMETSNHFNLPKVVYLYWIVGICILSKSPAAKEVNQPWCDELLKRPASSEPTAIPKGFLPCPLVIHPVVRLGDIRKVDVAARSVLIPPKHGIDRRAKLNCILLIDTAGIYPEVFKPIDCGLLCAELYLPPPSLVHSLTLVLALLQVSIDDLLFSPGMREYCVGRDFAAGRFMKDDLAVRFALQEVY